MTEWKKARKRPVIIEFREVKGLKEVIKTRGGILYAYQGSDYIIRGVQGEIYPIDKVIFHQTYEVLEPAGRT